MTDAAATAIQVLSRVSGMPAEEIGREMELVADLGIDSPKALEFLLELEEALDIEVDDEDAAGMETVADVLGYVAGLE
jgi:acyl carrier protein